MFTLTNNNLSYFYKGRMQNINKEHPLFSFFKEHIEAGHTANVLIYLTQPASLLNQWKAGYFSREPKLTLTYKDLDLDLEFTKTVLNLIFYKENYPFENLGKFLEKVIFQPLPKRREEIIKLALKSNLNHINEKGNLIIKGNLISPYINLSEVKEGKSFSSIKGRVINRSSSVPLHWVKESVENKYTLEIDPRFILRTYQNEIECIVVKVLEHPQSYV